MITAMITGRSTPPTSSGSARPARRCRARSRQGRDRRQALHAPDHRRAERAEQERRVEHLPELGPSTPMRRNIATNARKPARPHTTLCSRRTGMPSSDARSAFSASARSATPIAENRKNATSPSEHDRNDDHGEHVVAEEVRAVEPAADREVQVDERRVLHDRAAAEPLRQQQTRARPATSVTPIVATVRMSRGAGRSAAGTGTPRACRARSGPEHPVAVAR